MKIAGLLLPPAFLVVGIALSHYFPAAPAHSPPSISGVPVSAASSPAQDTAAATPRPSQPALADWWDFLQTLERATLEDLPALWEALPASDPSSPRQILVVDRWAELDPSGALAILDPEAALTALQGETDPEIQALGAAGFLLSFTGNTSI